MKRKSIPGAVLGIIGGVFGVLGGLYLAMCGNAVAALSGGLEKSFLVFAYVFGLGSGVFAILGAVFDFSKPKLGGAFQFIALVFMIVACIKLYWAFLCIIAMILDAVGGILSFVISKEA